MKAAISTVASGTKLPHLGGRYSSYAVGSGTMRESVAVQRQSESAAAADRSVAGPQFAASPVSSRRELRRWCSRSVIVNLAALFPSIFGGTRFGMARLRPPPRRRVCGRYIALLSLVVDEYERFIAPPNKQLRERRVEDNARLKLSVRPHLES
jgi:hypothetical protein